MQICPFARCSWQSWHNYLLHDAFKFPRHIQEQLKRKTNANATFWMPLRTTHDLVWPNPNFLLWKHSKSTTSDLVWPNPNFLLWKHSKSTISDRVWPNPNCLLWKHSNHVINANVLIHLYLFMQLCVPIKWTNMHCCSNTYTSTEQHLINRRTFGKIQHKTK
jgi:hypothetical protein